MGQKASPVPYYYLIIYPHMTPERIIPFPPQLSTIAWYRRLFREERDAERLAAAGLHLVEEIEALVERGAITPHVPGEMVPGASCWASEG